MRRSISVVIVSLVLSGFTAAGAAAAPNPSGTGQPNADCEAPGMIEPAGFSSGGFQHAQTVYANPGVVPANASSHAVSQYDVACYQQTSNQG
jgi:hypothetical protein